MKFSEYMVSCRKRYDLTQEQLVQELYNFDDTFHALDVVTLSRWERGVTQPSLAKQLLIVKLFTKYSTHLFPCFFDKEDVERELCRVGVVNLLGKSKDHIFDLPESVIQIESTNIRHVRSFENIKEILQFPHSITHKITDGFYGLTIEHLHNFALYPSNFLLLAEQNAQIFGMLATLRLKVAVFNQLVRFEKKVSELQDEDFAHQSEESCIFLLPSYAYNERIATLMLLRYYAHLITNQDNIVEVGSLATVEGGHALAKKMHLAPLEDANANGRDVTSYTAPLEDVLINADVLKMIFSKQNCPEDDN